MLDFAFRYIPFPVQFLFIACSNNGCIARIAGYFGCCFLCSWMAIRSRAYAIAFCNFCSLLPENGLILGWGEDVRVARMMGRVDRRHETFGYTDACDWYPAHLVIGDLGKPSFDLMYHGEKLAAVHLNVAGRFNILNALAALAGAGFNLALSALFLLFASLLMGRK